MHATRRRTPDAPSYLDASLVSLAREIAQGILPLDDILRNHGFDGAHDPLWHELRARQDFDALLRGAIQEWQAADSTPKRVKLKAAAATEVLIPTAVQMTSDVTVAASAKIEAMKWLSSLAGFRDGAVPQNTAAFSITFVMGDEVQTVVPGRRVVDASAPVALPTEIPKDSDIVPESLVTQHARLTGIALETEVVPETVPEATPEREEQTHTQTGAEADIDAFVSSLFAEDATPR